ncbi:signal peptide peptidase SppA [uncultured Fusobacterium sp.]|uniref:signal peptide peptidase SppA n=1 Tax=uncultured Fusobacterium sp. TaxID=159267 RepID=UPI000BBAC8FE|nr:signal peptide peptidase SppA [uncultured Fusobacterium sp.]BBA52130.1 signal peptidase [Fusobacterium varium]
MKFLNFLKKFILGTILFVIKEIFSFFIKAFLFLLVIFSIGAFFAKTTLEKDKIIIEKGSYIEVDLSKDYKEKGKNLPEFLRGQDTNFFSMLKTFDYIERDNDIKGVVLKLDNLSLDSAQVEELGKKLDNLKKSKKEVYSYMTMADNKNYSLAIKSNHIFMPPTMSAPVNITGYYGELMYYKLLADKLGIEFNVIHVGDYKAYGENLTKEHISKEYKENIERMYNRKYANFIKNIAAERKVNHDFINEKILNGDLMASEPNQMKKLNLVDEFMYFDQLKQVIGDKKLLSYENYNAFLSKNSLLGINGNKRKDKIAVIYAEGTMFMDSSSGGISGSITPNTLIEEINKALKDNTVKGIVLRINSPGGSALAANIISNKIIEVNEIKPIYVSIGGVGASGGYYIAAVAEKIYADKDSLTGSIGVVSIIPNIKKMLGNISINVDEVKKGEYSDIYSMVKDFNADKRDKLYASNLKVYNEFLDTVSFGRKLNRQHVERIAQGKVWLGEEALELGLVDEIGGLESAVKGLADDLKLVEYDTIEIINAPNYDSILKRYVPAVKMLEEYDSFILDKELYFKPIYYFPYDI